MSPALRQQLVALVSNSRGAQSKMAEAVGLDRSAISRFLAGKAEPSVNSLEAMAEACGGEVVIKKRLPASPESAALLRRLEIVIDRVDPVVAAAHIDALERLAALR